MLSSWQEQRAFRENVSEQRSNGPARDVSVVIPVFNEEDNVAPLYHQLTEALSGLARKYEIIFVNDGSTDKTEGEIEKVAREDDRVRAINFRRNFGQTAALMAGIDHSVGRVIIPMDGDLQNDPADVGKLLAMIEQGYDVVSGWRKDRKDPLMRTLTSVVANFLVRKISGVQLHDFGCSLKAYHRSVIENVRLYGEMHRFVPIYASWHGGKVGEVVVNHKPRISGKSKYGFNRAYKVVLDLIVIKFLTQYETKPIHIFGGIGLLAFILSFLAGVFAVYLKFAEGTSFILTPLPLLAVFFFISGVICILMGLLAEMLVRTYYESQTKPIYYVKSTVNLSIR
jgi:glycosyltransferase involved in cell wall biosynthesis